MSKILVTGGAGFMGSHLVDALCQSDADVVVLDNLRRGRLQNIQRHLDSKRVEFVEGDIRDLDQVKRAVQGVDIIYHLAAQSNVMGSMTEPNYSFETNVIGTYNVLLAASEAGVGKVVFSSSREAYGEPTSLPVCEEANLQPKNMYGASKLAGEAYCRAFDGTTGLRCVVLRFGNVYGERDYGRVIPLWLGQALQGDELKLYGGEQVLDFVPVDMAVTALVRAATLDEFGPINVATGRGTTLVQLAAYILTETESNSQLVTEPARDIEVTKFVADVTKMRASLRIEPPINPLCGIPSMIERAVAAAAVR